MKTEFESIAYIETDFPEKFGLPRQGYPVSGLSGKIVFEKEYRRREAIRGLENFSHLWIIWAFSENINAKKSFTVRPPRLGGNKRIGVFATRSPFRPNPIGMSCVKIEKIEENTSKGPVIYVTGADMKNGTPILDLKPYLPFCDSFPDAKSGFAGEVAGHKLEVEIQENFLAKIPEKLHQPLVNLLKDDPRPSYKEDSEHIYKFLFSEFEVGFCVQNGVLKVKSVDTVK